MYDYYKYNLNVMVLVLCKIYYTINQKKINFKTIIIIYYTYLLNYTVHFICYFINELISYLLMTIKIPMV